MKKTKRHVSINRFSDKVGLYLTISRGEKMRSYKPSEPSKSRLTLFTWRNMPKITIHVSGDYPSMWFDWDRA